MIPQGEKEARESRENLVDRWTHPLRSELAPLADAVVVEMARKHGVTAKAIYSRSRLGPVVRARHEAWVVLRTLHRWSFPAIALVFGVDHTTVIAGTRKICEETRYRVHVGPRFRIAV